MKHFSFSTITITLLVIASHFFASNFAMAQAPKIVTRVLVPSQNFEIALGDSVTPSARIINTGTKSVTGLTIYYRIQNPVTGASPYFDSILLPTILPGDSIDEAFAAYVTNADSLSEVGMFNASLIAKADTVSTLLFVLRGTALPFADYSDGYEKTIANQLSHTAIDIPSQYLWTSGGATVVDGERATWDPPPPRYPGAGIGPDAMVGPVIRLDRLDYNGNFYAGNNAGDTLTSYPINLEGKTHFILAFDYMRGGRHYFPLGWDKDTMFGPESTILNANTGEVVRPGDSLVLEFRDPSEPALNVPASGWNEIAAIDGGHDFEYKSFYAQVDSGVVTITLNGKTKTFSGTPDYLTADFRFRLRLKASSNSTTSSPVDDADQWYIDNPRVENPAGPSVEVNWVRVVTPYTKVPYTQAVYPVFAHVVTGNLNGSTPQPITVQIIDPAGDTVYSQSITPKAFGSAVDAIFQFPNWDATNERGPNGPFTAIASVSTTWSTPAALDQTYTHFYLNSATKAGSIQEFAMDDAGSDPTVGQGNEIPELTGIPGTGIGFINNSGSYAMKFQLMRPDTFYGVRAYFGSANHAPDYVRFSLMSGDVNSNTPVDTLQVPGLASTLTTVRGPLFDQFMSYYYPRPIPLKPGVYWISVSQLGVASMELGGSIARGGAQIVKTDPFLISPEISAMYGPSLPGSQSYGTQWGSGPNDNNGDVTGSWAIEATAGSGGWAELMPSVGWYPEMANGGLPFSETVQPALNLSNQFTGAGIYAPMIRPIIDPLSAESSVRATQSASALSLAPNFPNPFTPSSTSTEITFTLDVQSPTTLTISNVLGDVVKTLVSDNLSAGIHNVLWDGKDENGAVVPPGTYLMILSSEGRSVTSKVVVME